MTIPKSGRTSRWRGGLRSARFRPRVRNEEERLEVHRGWQRRVGAGDSRREGESPCAVSIVRGEDLIIPTQTATACERIKKNFRWRKM